MELLEARNIIAKKAGETILCRMQFGEWLESSETIDTITATAETGLTVSDATVSGTDVIVTVSGGTEGEAYYVQIEAVTSNSQTLIGEGKVKIIKTRV